ncbi:uncharacterized protein LOC142241135 isoform X1 [Haematobia irritans]|uniref:uncharacterized protein LOC142241135 isoform X1 n=1 Tax=Haematobia irritans TaxID=7368 RepID=UPI003F504242
MTEEPLLETILERFWNVEECSPSPTQGFTVEEEECEKMFKETTTRCPVSNKFIVRLPFKVNPSVLGSSFEISQRRFYSLENKLYRNPNLWSEYGSFIREYIQLQHMELAKPTENITYNYIPHHWVTKLDSSTTKLRVVFDASCRTNNGIALNEILRVGPTLQEDIFTILIRFRYHKFALVADIAKMYRQVLVDERDCQWQCILWRNSPSDPLETYKLKTLTYGTSSAPYLAVKCLQELATTHSQDYPIGSMVALRDFYVDNLMTGGNTIESTIQIKREVSALLQKGGFILRKFAASDERILADVPMVDREEIIKVDDTQFVKTLGLKWSPDEDVFSYSFNDTQHTLKKTTKRVILSNMAKLFDPLGLVSPIVVRCKMLLQIIWAQKLHWDETVPQDVLMEWNDVKYQLMLAAQLKIPRFVAFNNYTNIHAFADASIKAYGACIYVVTREFGVTKSSLLCAKSRVAPLKPITLPRLELCAAVLLVQLLNSVLHGFPSSPQSITCWSDSMITLCWIAGNPTRWNTFVSNRVTKIKEGSCGANWRHVPSDLNPADIVSRGATTTVLTNNRLWFHGPQFLLQDEVKAVHLELVPDLTTNAFIAALKRFISRRGYCSTIYSDNATNFIGANRELKDLLKLFLTQNHNQLVEECCRSLGIEWKFIPPRSPHFGGLWESAVKKAKYYLRRAIGTHILTFDELHTVTCQAEAIINSRPLTPISSDPNDLHPLTPAHFLVGRPLTTIPEPSQINENPSSLKRYHILRWIHQTFWDRWRNEYLNTIQQKTKWAGSRQNLQLNDLVLIKEDTSPPLKWPMGRIVATHPGEDGFVSVVTVRTIDGTFKRAVAKLCKLPIETAETNIESKLPRGENVGN